MKMQAKRNGRPVSNRVSRLLLVGTLLATVVVTIGVVVGLSRPKANKNGKPERTAPIMNSGKGSVRNAVGQKLGIDAQTGQVRPLTQQEAQQLAEELKRLANQSTEGLQSVRHADGTVSINLEDRFQNVTLARKNEDGSLTQSCVDNPRAGAEFLGIDPKLVETNSKTRSGLSVIKPAKN